HLRANRDAPLVLEDAAEVLEGLDRIPEAAVGVRVDHVVEVEPALGDRDAIAVVELEVRIDLEMPGPRLLLRLGEAESRLVTSDQTPRLAGELYARGAVVGADHRR